ncbi:MAG: class I SAM-dependent methyltransferase [bacterium]|nr:class I SAM-dependent methyltransferase [bacterium]
MTKLETIVAALLGEQSREETAKRDAKAFQQNLDRVTPEAMKQLTPKDIADHMRSVYDETANAYAENPHTQHVVDEIVEFMNLMPDNGIVLDAGCGTGRDACYMACNEGSCRAPFMERKRKGIKTIDRYAVPKNACFVVAIDGSKDLLDHAIERYKNLRRQSQKRLPITFVIGDIHQLQLPHISAFAPFDGIWSCTALFTHTPEALVDPVLKDIAKLLKPGGIFFTSYTNGAVAGPYDKLLASQTGRIKYFSQPDPKDIAERAKQAGLALAKQTFGDFEVNDKVIKPNLFVSQFFVKPAR